MLWVIGRCGYGYNLRCRLLLGLVWVLLDVGQDVCCKILDVAR